MRLSKCASGNMIGKKSVSRSSWTLVACWVWTFFGGKQEDWLLLLRVGMSLAAMSVRLPAKWMDPAPNNCFFPMSKIPSTVPKAAFWNPGADGAVVVVPQQLKALGSQPR